MKIKIFITSLILVLTSLTSLYAQIFTQDLKVTAKINGGVSDRSSWDQFGGGVAISGNYAIVGAVGEDTDEYGNYPKNNAGAAYIFERPNSTSPWVFKQKIVAPIPDRGENDTFGSVAISGNYAIVGASREDHDENGLIFKEDAGAAYIFERDILSPFKWVFKQKIVAPGRAAKDYFGGGVSISGDYIIVGAAWDGPRALPYNFGAGSAYIFERCTNNNTWTFTKKLQANDRTEGDLFGSVSISGSYAIVGAHRESEDDNSIPSAALSEAGSAYIFERDLSKPLCDNNAWPQTQTQKIVAQDRSTLDRFGYSVAISGDYAIVGAYAQYTRVVNPLLELAGSAYIFERTSSLNKPWKQTKKIIASDRNKKVEFGIGVAIDGNYAIVGAYRHDAVINPDHEWNSGAAYIFDRNTAPYPWEQVGKIVSSDVDQADIFGRWVAISGCSALVSASLEDEDTNLGNTIDRAGSAYFFECEEPPAPELCCDIPAVTLAFNQYRNTDKFNLNINSGGAGIQEVEVSVIDYHVEYESAYCQPKDLGIFGNIRSTTSNFGGLLRTDNNTHSLTWVAGTPSVINGTIGILISKPKLVVDFRRCRNNTFYFCLKVKITDTDCNVCEKIVCGSLKLGPSQNPGDVIIKPF